MRLEHPIPPVYDEHSRVLMLGSFPSPKSREFGFFYGHPQNRMWPILSAVTGEADPLTKEGRAALLLRHGIAMWDSIAGCEITGAADSSIKNPVVNDFGPMFAAADIQMVFAAGRQAAQMYTKYIYPATGREVIYLPSTSPANRQYPLEQLIEIYGAALRPYLR